MKRILVTGVGGDVAGGIVNCISDEFSDVTIFGADIQKYVHHLDKFEKHFVIPRYSTAAYLPAIQDICIEYKITHFIPSTEPEILIANDNRKFFVDNNINLLINNETIINIATSKYKTAKFLKEHGLFSPETYKKSEMPTKQIFPLIVKPEFGRGSAQVRIVGNKKELDVALKEVLDPVVQHYIGTAENEYTVGVFSDGIVTNSVAFRRKLGFGGMSVFVETVAIDELDQISRKCADILNLKGSINIQIREEMGKYYIIEINPRISSTVGFRHSLGFKDLIWWINLFDKDNNTSLVSIEPGIIGIKTFTEQLFYPPISNIEDYSILK